MFQKPPLILEKEMVHNELVYLADSQCFFTNANGITHSAKKSCRNHNVCYIIDLSYTGHLLQDESINL